MIFINLTPVLVFSVELGCLVQTYILTVTHVGPIGTVVVWAIYDGRCLRIITRGRYCVANEPM